VRAHARTRHRRPPRQLCWPLRALAGLALATGLWLVAEALVPRFFPAQLQAWQAPPPTDQPGAPYMPGNPYLLWELAPGVREERGLEVHINHLGLRGPEPVQPKPPGTRRLLVTGDSSVYGDGVPDGATFTEVAAARLGPPVDAVNAGIPGYATWQTLNLLRMRGLALQPDLVVVANLWSDNNFDSFVDRDLITAYAAYREGPVASLRGLLAHSEVYRLLDWELRVRRRAEAVHKVGWMLGRPEKVGARRVSIQDYAHNLQALVDLARVHGAEVLFVELANDEDLAGPPSQHAAWLPYRRVMEDTARRVGAPLLDVPARFRDSGLDAPALFLDHMHPTVLGHQIIGEALAELLVKAGWPAGEALHRRGTGGAVPRYEDPNLEGVAAQEEP